MDNATMALVETHRTLSTVLHPIFSLVILVVLLLMGIVWIIKTSSNKTTTK